MSDPTPPKVDIKPLLKKLWPVNATVSPTEIAQAISHFFTNQVSPAQTASLLICLHYAALDLRADVMAECARVMREAAAPIDVAGMKAVIQERGMASGEYAGGLCDIVGTGGDSHNTFNISTTSSILASPHLLISKHGNRASTSKSGSADVIACMPTPPHLDSVKPSRLTQIYRETNYAFLFAPVFHPGMRYVAPVRKELPWRTIFNNLGPLANPVEDVLEARVIGVARRDLGRPFADALKMVGVKKALIVCGEEQLDEVSCAGGTECWMVRESPQGEVYVDEFRVTPEDFGLSRHSLSEVSGGKEPEENAKILTSILKGELPGDSPLIEFILMNTAALLVISGVVNCETTNMGPGDDGIVITETGPGGLRWKEGVRRARWGLTSGEAWNQWNRFTKVTNEIKQSEL